MILIKDIILIQDKGRGVTILDRIDYIEKCVLILNTSQFRKLNTNLTKRLEGKVQRTLRKKHELEDTEYKWLYQADWRPRLFYATPKVHKLPLCEKCLYSELFWSLFSRIRTRVTRIKATFCTVYNSNNSTKDWKNLR